MLVGSTTLASELDPSELLDIAGRLRHPCIKYQSERLDGTDFALFPYSLTTMIAAKRLQTGGGSRCHNKAVVAIRPIAWSHWASAPMMLTNQSSRPFLRAPC